MNRQCDIIIIITINIIRVRRNIVQYHIHCSYYNYLHRVHLYTCIIYETARIAEGGDGVN